jgi:hypothetical protein
MYYPHLLRSYFSAEEFIATITQHIPDKHSRIVVRDKLQMVRYYGWYSSRSRGERIKAGLFRPGDESATLEVNSEVTVLDVSEHRPRRVPSKTWRELIKKIWEVDPLSCPRCGDEMRVISLIHEPAVIRKVSSVTWGYGSSTTTLMRAKSKPLRAGRLSSKIISTQKCPSENRRHLLPKNLEKAISYHPAYWERPWSSLFSR